MVRRNVSLDLLEAVEALEEAVLEHRVELVLNARQHRILLVNVQAERIERRVPIERVQIQKLEVVNDLGHASLHFCLVEELLHFERVDRLWQLLVSRLVPWETTLKSRKTNKRTMRN